MLVKKAGGKIYGAVLTSAEKKAMNMEIERQLAEYTRKHEVELNEWRTSRTESRLNVRKR